MIQWVFEECSLAKVDFLGSPGRGSKKSKVEYMPMDQRRIKCYWQCCHSLGCWKSESMLWCLNTSSHTMKAIPENNMYSRNKIMANEVWVFLNSLKAQKYIFCFSQAIILSGYWGLHTKSLVSRWAFWGDIWRHPQWYDLCHKPWKMIFNDLLRKFLDKYSP